MDIVLEGMKMAEKNLRWGAGHEVLEKIMQSASVSDRNKRIACRVLNGEFLHDVAKDYGITRERIKQISIQSINRVNVSYDLERLKDIRYIKTDKFDYLIDMELGIRAINCIINENLSKGELIDVMATAQGQRKMLSVPNFGRKSLRELCIAIDAQMLI